MFTLDYLKVSKLEGWGDKSTNNLKNSIEKSKNITLDKFIFSLGIRHIGQENAKLLAQYFSDIKNFLKLTNNFDYSLIGNIDGIGETQINSLKKFFKNNINNQEVKKLSELMLIKSSSVETSGKLKSYSFMFTGKLSNISRAEAKSLTERNSGKILSNVTKKLNYLVIGENPTPKKVKMAEDLGISVITQSTWQKMLD